MQQVSLISFSPTGNTRRVVQAIAAGTGLRRAECDLTRLTETATLPVFGTVELVIAGAPVYVGSPWPSSAA